MTLRKDLADPADPRDRAATRPRYPRPGEPLKNPAGADTATPAAQPTPEEDETIDEGSARPLPDPQGEGRF